jgi:phospholipase/carboxylesterase
MLEPPHYRLDCAAADHPDTHPADSLLLLFHGYGSNADDLMSLASLLRPALPRTLFLAPHAPQPCPSPMPGRAWFALGDQNPAEFDLDALSARAAKATPALCDFIEDAIQQHHLTIKDVALLGFSQGTMMALSAALSMPQSPIAVVGFSGALVHRNPPLDPTLIVQLIHGTHDPVVPFIASQRALQQLQQWQVNTELIARNGLDHSIDLEGIKAAAQLLGECLKPNR